MLLQIDWVAVLRLVFVLGILGVRIVLTKQQVIINRIIEAVNFPLIRLLGVDLGDDRRLLLRQNPTPRPPPQLKVASTPAYAGGYAHGIALAARPAAVACA